MPPPALVIVARSETDGYCPSTLADALEDAVVAAVRGRSSAASRERERERERARVERRRMVSLFRERTEPASSFPRSCFFFQVQEQQRAPKKTRQKPLSNSFSCDFCARGEKYVFLHSTEAYGELEVQRDLDGSARRVPREGTPLFSFFFYSLQTSFSASFLATISFFFLDNRAPLRDRHSGDGPDDASAILARPAKRCRRSEERAEEPAPPE